MKKLIYIIISLLLFQTMLFAKAVGSITGMSGQIYISRLGTDINATLGDKIEEKDIIVSGDNSKTQLTFDDNTLITIGKNSRFVIEEYLFEESAEAKAMFGIKEGAFRAITGKIAKFAPNRFKVKTKSAAIGIRGTNFFILASLDQPDLIGCTYGTIFVEGINTVDINRGFYAQVMLDGMVQPPKAYDLKNLNVLLKKGFKTKAKTKSDDTKSSDKESAQDLDEAVDEIVDEGLTTSNVDNEVQKQISDTITDASQEIITNSELEDSGHEPMPEGKINTGYATLAVADEYDGISGVAAVDGIYKKDSHNSNIDYLYFSDHLDSATLKIAADDKITLVSMSDETVTSWSGTRTTHQDNADYFSWGEWNAVMTFNDGYEDEYHSGYWTSGVVTDPSVISDYHLNSLTAQYSGKLMGEVLGPDANLHPNMSMTPGISPILSNSNNSVLIDVDFGANKIKTHMSFDAAGFNYKITSDNGAIVGSDFHGTITSITRDETNLDLTNNSIPLEMQQEYNYEFPNSTKGKFYGPEGKTIGGTFGISSYELKENSVDIYSIHGAFEATTDSIK